MKMTGIPFGTTDWAAVERTEHKGDTGVAYWRTRTFGDIRVRMVEYSAGYVADHWCKKGHVLLCLEGELHIELEGWTYLDSQGGHELSGRRRGARRIAPTRTSAPSSSSLTRAHRVPSAPSSLSIARRCGDRWRRPPAQVRLSDLRAGAGARLRREPSRRELPPAGNAAGRNCHHQPASEEAR